MGDHRLVFVQPADELKIEAAADAAVYKPGDEARIRFRVTNSQGEGVQAALGLQVVDEAVFALAEKQPGFAKVFFYLEQEVMKPRYEIHSIGMPDIVEPVPVAQAEQRDRAARALFAATEMVSGNKFETEVGRTVPQTKYAEYATRYQARFQAQVQQMRGALTHAYQQNRNAGRPDQSRCEDRTLRDAWDTGIAPGTRWTGIHNGVTTACAARARISASIPPTIWRLCWKSARARSRDRPARRQMSIDLQVEHDRGPFNGLAEIAGSVKDTTGAAVPGATITAREAATGATRTATTNAAGQFTLAGLCRGRIPAPSVRAGFQDCVADGDSQGARPGGALRGTERGRVDRSVVVDQFDAGRIVVGGNVQGLQGAAGGVPGGVIGGVIGGVVAGIAGAMPRQFAASAKAVPMMAEMALMDRRDLNTATLAKKEKDSVGGAAPHVRSYFPEALYINPEIITDHDGRASIAIPMADSITTWRMAMLASTTHGALGSGTSQPESLSGFLRRSRSAGHAHARRPRLDPGGRLQLLRRRAATSACNCSRTTGSRWWKTFPRRTSRWIPAAWADRSSRSKPSASANSN